MQMRRVGANGPAMMPLGLGCWVMIGSYGEVPEARSIETIHRALEFGVTMLDTADVYGFGGNEELIGKALRGRRDQALVATKVGARLDAPVFFTEFDGRPEYIREACDASLGRLGIDHIDFYHLHRADPKVPIEETVGAMGDLVTAGKVRHIGLSEVSPDTLRRAHAAYPITSLQTEYSLWSREPEEELLGVVRDLGIAFIAYAPLGRGALTGTVKSADDLASDDRRRAFPRFSAENLARNQSLLDVIESLARDKDATVAQISLAWVLHQGKDIIPIPGADRPEYVEQNVAACDITLGADDLSRLDAAMPIGAAAGSRMPDDS